jgi:lambda family phage portal protein
MQQYTGGAYEAVNNRQRRKVRTTNLRSEDDILTPQNRDKLVSEARNLRRNAPEVSWAVRTHVCFVSTFNFQCRSGNAELDRRIESLMDWWSRAQNVDVAGRHSLQELTHLAETLRTSDGDCFFLTLRNGQVQLIEGDRVRTPTHLGNYEGKIDAGKFVHGVEVDEDGAPKRYAVCDREGNSFVLRDVLPARHVHQLAYFDRADAVRGVSPLASAITTFCDLYESREYALAKAKLSQLFALKMTLAGDVDEAEAGEGYTFDFGTGPQTLQLAPGDEADFLESKTPSNEFQAFLETGIQIGLKALDIPYSFFAENYTNYSGARQALNLYEQLCERKRKGVRQLLNNLTAWRLRLFIVDGELELPAGWTLDDVKWEWIPQALPWIDPQREANANATLLANNLASHQQLAKEQGLDWFTIMDQRKAEQDYITKLGLSSVDASTAAPAAAPPADQSALAERVAELVIEAIGSRGQ